MNKERAIYFAGLMEEYLNIPACVCEYIENELVNEKYNKVINYIIDRRKELENDEDYISYQKIGNMYLELEERINKAIEILGKYKHYSVPNEKQNSDNEDIVNDAYEALKGEDNE